VKSLRELNSTHSTALPHFFDNFIRTAQASSNLPFWVNAPPEGDWIVSKGEGSSISEAKATAERDGNLRISSAIRKLIDQSFAKPIYKSLENDVQKSLINLAEKRDVFFEVSGPSKTYWIRYHLDQQTIKELLAGVTFPLTIFSTKLISDKTAALKSKLTEYGFTVTIAPAPRGPYSETNAIFVGEGVPVSAVKETVQFLIAQDIPLKVIAYPWVFQKSNLPEAQKINHLQIGGTSTFEESSKFNQTDLSRLSKVSSKNDLKAFCKETTDKLKSAWGLPIQ
jgi:hypothetical protein